ncbi:hypothetical protein GCM10007423_36140 [Dyadobacter endophyticus]|uniref:DUF3108 domain-containing protein n=1 Tax=Dyadobacter endophyticus TaxID=1749036 RepID=A0ABQ1YVX1_9BACT|nr:hypothetical protein [Dyadobacter endophyticus]GGH40815.1 hypothetical protein GCM10007423_36140 [Dyadobacter endophyticus]
MKLKSQSPSIVLSRFAKSALALAVLAMSFAACKDDDNPNPDGGGDGGGTEKAFIPTKDKSYTYKITDSEGSTGDMITKIVSTKDSAGMDVHTISNFIRENEEEKTFMSKAYAKGGTTTNELPYPVAIKEMVNAINDVAYISEMKVTGFPQFQYLENNGKVNSPLTFKGDPIRLLLELEIPAGDEGSVLGKLEARMTHKNGKAVAEESITTPAGEFKCTKWEYSYEVYTKFETEVTEPEITTELVNVTLWTAPGVGVVKTIEKGEESTSTTELRKIE